jgi:uncharacterized GH25 family protein
VKRAPSVRPRPPSSSRRTITAIVTVLAVVAAWILIADRGAKRAPEQHANATRWLQLKAGPVLGVIEREPFEVRLAGTIRDPAGKPIARAAVCAACAECLPGPSSSRPTCVTTDAQGRYAIDDLGLGDFRLSAGADGYEPALVHGGEIVRVGAKGLWVDGFDAVLKEGGARIAGFVMDGTGGPVVGASVEAHFMADEAIQRRPVPLSTLSDENGAFTLSVRSEGVQVIARADGYAPASLYTNAPAADLRLVLAPSSEIAGHVVTLRDGQPVANVRVTAEQGNVQQFATSDDQGAFQITGLAPGTFFLKASGNGWIGETSGTLSIGLGERVADLLVPVVRGARVLGSVRVGDAPCTTGLARLSAASGQSLPTLSAHTDREGNVIFEAAPPGVYRSLAVCDGYDQLDGPEVTVREADVEGLVWSVPAGAEATIVAKTTGGMPAERTWIDFDPVIAADAQPGPKPQSRSGWTDARGEIAFKGLRPMGYRITGTDITKPIDVELRERSNRYEITIDPRGYIDLYVRAASGEPNDEVWAYARRMDEKGPPGTAERYDRGRYRIGPLEEGKFHVQVRDGANPSVHARDVQVRPGQVTNLEITYGSHDARITGRVLDTAGDPVADVWVSAEASDAAQDNFTRDLEHVTRAERRRVYTDQHGRFEVGGLDPRGTYQVVVTRPLGGEQRRAGVSAGQNVEVVLPRTATVAGRVLEGDGEPSQRFHLILNNESTNQSLQPIFGPDSSGRFRLEDVTAGKVELAAYTPGGERAKVVLDVSAGQEIGGIVLTLAPIQAAHLTRSRSAEARGSVGEQNNNMAPMP